MKIEKSFVNFPFDEKILVGNEVETSKKLLKDAAELYANPEAARKDEVTVAYEVYAYGKGDEKVEGNLYSGLTVLAPLTVDGECNMTRGHFHVNRDCAEFYIGIEGEGLLLLMDESGQTWAEQVTPGSVHYIDGHWAHRLVNTGDVNLKVGACWPTTAGHDYEATEKLPFGYRVYKKDGEIQFKKVER